MLSDIIRGIIRFRYAVLAAAFAATFLSFYAIVRAPLDAIPDLSDPQIVIYVKWPRSPQLIEAEATEPLIRAVVGSPGVRSIRGASHMGYSFIYVILNDANDRERVRQLVMDRINAIRPQLPQDATVSLGPNASSMGWIYQYALIDREATHDLRQLRLLNESQIKPALQTVPGVAELASVGGLEEQYQVRLYPPLLATTGIPIRNVIATLRSAFQESGGRTIEVTNREYQIRGAINSDDIDKLEHLIVGRSKDGRAVHLKDVGYIQIGYDLRRSTADLDGTGEVVGGIAIMEQDQNVLAVTRSLELKLDEIRRNLPPGLEIVASYDRSAWIWTTLREFFATLVTELLVLILVTALFLGTLRTAIGPIAVLLLSTLFTALPLFALGQTINLFALAGLCIAIGEIADATIVIIENCAAELTAHGTLSLADKREIIVHSIAAVARPLLFSLAIILASFLPVFFLEEREARLFNPLAYSKTFAMGFSTLLTLCLLPVLAVWIFERKDTVNPLRYRRVLAVAGVVAAAGGVWWFRDAAREFLPEILELGIFLIPVFVLRLFRRRQTTPHLVQETAPARLYRSLLAWTIRHRYACTTLGLLTLIPGAILLSRFQRDFLPETDEGSILYMPTTLPGLPTREAGWVLQQMDKKLKAIPEVERVFGKLGRADTSTDPAPVSMVETTILLKPRSEWRPGVTKSQIVAEMDQAMNIVGYVNTWVQPIRARVMMQSTGIQTPVGIKVKGPDIAVIEELSQNVETLLRSFEGTKSVIAERISTGYYIDVQNDLERMAQHAVTVDEAMETVRYGIGGDNILTLDRGNGATVPLSVQYSPEYIDTVEKVKTTPIISADGSTVLIGDVADVTVRKLPEMMRNDDGQLAGYVYIDIQGITASEYVEKAQHYLRENMQVPSGYALEWTGVYQYTEAADQRLRVIVPLTLVIIFVLLLAAFRSIGESILIMLSVPFAMVGGVFLQWWLGYSMTTAVIVGYISLFAIAVQTGIIMVVFIREALAERREAESFVDAVIRGSASRLRPKLMTVAATLFSLAPIVISTRPGMDILKPIAAPGIGGMFTSTLHVLFMTPCLFVIVEDVRHSERFKRFAARFGATGR
jgi:Cu(I)/Ag(I) efflux system membrane protein CusA/SilA